MQQRIWDGRHVKVLLRQPTTLLREETYRAWISEHGGLSTIYQQLESIRLPSKLSELRTLLLEAENTPACDVVAKQLNISTKTVYRHMDRLAIELATALNQLDHL